MLVRQATYQIITINRENVWVVYFVDSTEGISAAINEINKDDKEMPIIDVKKVNEVSVPIYPVVKEAKHYILHEASTPLYDFQIPERGYLIDIQGEPFYLTVEYDEMNKGVKKPQLMKLKASDWFIDEMTVRIFGMKEILTKTGIPFEVFEPLRKGDFD